MRKSIIAIVITLTTIATTTALAQKTFSPPPLKISYTPIFTCAPHLETFLVKPLDQRQGTGIRCVKRSEGRAGNPRIPALAWYGEGNWNGKTYRHVGHAFYQRRNLLGAAADFKENIHNNFSFGSLNLELINTNTIFVRGAWNEVWIKVDQVVYKPLSRPVACGNYFNQYRVVDLAPGTRFGKGLRCALRSEHLPTELRQPHLPLVNGVTTWFGNGYWGDRHNTYSHLGTFSSNGYGASDICGLPFSPTTCNTFDWGSLRFRSRNTEHNVTGAWNERWSL